MTLRRTGAVAGTAVIAIMLTACAGGAAPQKSGEAGTVTFRSWSPIEQTTTQMVEAFEADNPGSTIDATIFNYPEYLVDLQTRASSNTFPDIVGLQPGALTQQYR
jgi:raffinose/stachyose/melibiose transport system substrate-binding protein